ncbi:MAG: hypothetical protein BWY82_01615 [Verrucomicrobia bacterium ADurb.Bin474]|nr:MAG: hypothetical protein BWY82_01615 [Verrucomicrobia bacterium ADurb.Bin474]
MRSVRSGRSTNCSRSSSKNTSSTIPVPMTIILPMLPTLTQVRSGNGRLSYTCVFKTPFLRTTRPTRLTPSSIQIEPGFADAANDGNPTPGMRFAHSSHSSPFHRIAPISVSPMTTQERDSESPGINRCALIPLRTVFWLPSGFRWMTKSTCPNRSPTGVGIAVHVPPSNPRSNGPNLEAMPGISGMGVKTFPSDSICSLLSQTMACGQLASIPFLRSKTVMGES